MDRRAIGIGYEYAQSVVGGYYLRVALLGPDSVLRRLGVQVLSAGAETVYVGLVIARGSTSGLDAAGFTAGYPLVAGNNPQGGVPALSWEFGATGGVWTKELWPGYRVLTGAESLVARVRLVNGGVQVYVFIGGEVVQVDGRGAQAVAGVVG